MLRLGLNIDHVATLRQARGGVEPDPVWAAALAELAGADGITVHMREDRRHIQERDVRILRQTVRTRLNLEAALDEAIIAFALDVRPEQVTLVPERREEVTTEGGLDIIKESARTSAAIGRLRQAGIETSLFIDPDPDQVKFAAELGADAVELHTGRYADARAEAEQGAELLALVEAGRIAIENKLLLHAGHGLNYKNVAPVARIAGMRELNIGHSIVSRAVFVGFAEAVREMRQVLDLAVSGRNHD